MAFKAYSGNRLEKLSDILISEMANSCNDAKNCLFKREIIVVQSKGMEKWLSMRIAEKTGISANISFPFPKSFVYEELLHRESGADYFDTDAMAFRVMNVLPDLISSDQSGVFSAPGNYVGDTAGEAKLKLYQLSCRIANLFDQYMVYRPRMLLGGWKDNGSGIKLDQSKSVWQKLLFERISRDLHSDIPAKLFLDIISRLDSAPSEILHRSLRNIPPRIFIFGISVMPPLFLEIFMALSKAIDVHFFHMSPCMEYCGDVVPEKSAIKESIKKGLDRRQLHTDSTNSILNSMGKYWSDFSSLITDRLEGNEEEFFVKSEGKDVLSAVQNAVLTLQTPVGREQINGLNIQFHSCHNRMREVEILFDNILRFIDEDGISPRDILVLSPDVGAYAPFIKAVFDTPEHPSANGGNPKYIPYSISDRKIETESPVFKAFSAILSLPDERYRASLVADVLDIECVRRKFDIGIGDMSKIRRWISEVNINWGIDLEYRTASGFPAFEEGSWRQGLQRLVLGFALGTEDNSRTWSAIENDHDSYRISPYDKIEEGDAIVLGKFANFAEKIFETGKQVSKDRTLSEWSEFLIALLDKFIKVDSDNSRQAERLRASLARLSEIEILSGYSNDVPAKIVLEHIKENLSKGGVEASFMVGGVTFCEMLPMRSIPFKVVCMLGMNDGDFPRKNIRYGFDLMADSPLKCDRDLKLEDRLLFLEAIISARRHLHISYIGQSMEDNAEIPPCGPVCDLMWYLTETFGCAKNEIFTKHPLQAFSYRNYMQGGKEIQLSYSRNNFLAAVELVKLGDKKTSHVFWPYGQKLQRSELDSNFKMEELSRFLISPTRYFLKNILGIRLYDGNMNLIDDHEILELDPRKAYNVRATLLEKYLRTPNQDSIEYEDLYRELKADGLLPPEPFAASAFRDILHRIVQLSCGFKAIIDEFLPAEIQDFTIDIDENLKLSGRISGIYSKGENKIHAFCVPAKKSVKNNLEAWVKHLILNAAGYKTESKVIFYDEDRPTVFSALEKEEAVSNLSSLVRQYKDGCSYPLPFFPETSYEFVRNKTGRDSENSAISKAETKYAGNEYTGGGESSDPYVRYCFTGSFFSAKEFKDYREDFKARSEEILKPMIESLGANSKKTKAAEGIPNEGI